MLENIRILANRAIFSRLPEVPLSVGEIQIQDLDENLRYALIRGTNEEAGNAFRQIRDIETRTGEQLLGNDALELISDMRDYYQANKNRN